MYLTLLSFKIIPLIKVGTSKALSKPIGAFFLTYNAIYIVYLSFVLLCIRGDWRYQLWIRTIRYILLWAAQVFKITSLSVLKILIKITQKLHSSLVLLEKEFIQGYSEINLSNGRLNHIGLEIEYSREKYKYFLKLCALKMWSHTERMHSQKCITK